MNCKKALRKHLSLLVSLTVGFASLSIAAVPAAASPVSDSVSFNAADCVGNSSWASSYSGVTYANLDPGRYVQATMPSGFTAGEYALTLDMCGNSRGMQVTATMNRTVTAPHSWTEWVLGNQQTDPVSGQLALKAGDAIRVTAPSDDLYGWLVYIKLTDSSGSTTSFSAPTDCTLGNGATNVNGWYVNLDPKQYAELTLPSGFVSGNYTVSLTTCGQPRNMSVTVTSSRTVAAPTYYTGFGISSIHESTMADDLFLTAGDTVRITAPSNVTAYGWLTKFYFTPVAEQSDICPITSSFDSSGNMDVTVTNPVVGYTYQLWAYTKVTPDLSGNNVYAWVNEPIATYDSSSSSDPFTFQIASPTTDQNGKYRFTLLTFDGSGNLVNQTYDTNALTPAQAGAASIQKVLVNGKTAGSLTVLDKDSLSSVPIEIDATENGTGALIYSLTYTAADGTARELLGSTLGTATLSIATLPSGSYAFKAKVTSGAYTDEQDFTVRVVSSKNSDSITYPTLSALDGKFNSSDGSLPLTLESPSIVNSMLYNFSVSEPGYTPSTTSFITPSDATLPSYTFTGLGYGTYRVAATVRRSSNIAADDTVIRYIPRTRDNPVTLADVTVGGNAAQSSYTAALSASPSYDIAATASGGNLSSTGEHYEYSFWRCDASGWVRLENWGTDSSLTWKPAYAGNYMIQIRAKGSGASSYEAAKNISFDITGDTSSSDASLSYTVNGATLSGETTISAVRTPVTLAAVMTNPGSTDQYLYRFDIWDQWTQSSILQAYSPDAACTWVPRKAGTYKITVMAINQNSFGMYDKSYTQTIVVD